VRCREVGRTPASARDPLVALLRDQAEWDEQMDRDSAAGTLDFLFAETGKEAEEGLLREWPSVR
jgi:hypothetical protein